MALPEQLADLERKVSARFSEALAEIRLEMRRAVQAEAQRASSAMLSNLDAIAPPAGDRLLGADDLLELTREAGEEARRDLARGLRKALVEFDSAKTQNAVLEALLASARKFGDHVALWLMRPETIVGWASRGFAGEPIAGSTLPLDSSSALARLATGRGCVVLGATEAAQLASTLEIAAPARALFLPLVLRDRVAAALYLDAATAGEFEVEALQMLTLAAAQRLELQALATRTYTPTLFLDDDAPASERGLALWDPTATPATPASVTSDAGAAAALAPVAPVAPVAEAAPAKSGAAAAESAWLASPAAALEVADVAPAPAPADTEEFAAAPAEEAPPTLVESMPTVAPGFDSEVPASLPERAAAEISWQLEEADETALIGSAPRAAAEPVAPELPDLADLPALAETAWQTSTPTHEIPLSALAPEPAAVEDLAASAAAEWREVEDATAPHATLSPAATQRFAVPAVTHEIPQPEPPQQPQQPEQPQIAAEVPLSQASAGTIAFAPPAAAPEMEADFADDATVRIQRSSLLPPTAPPVAAPPPLAPTSARPAIPSPGVADDEPTVSRGPRTTEVAPPADLQGPGWAFSSARSPRSSGDNALHEEARRLARLLVSEIKLYNEDQVEEGRHNRDIYHRLKDDIDRSRQIYEERVHETVRGTTDYFQQELIRSLAGGDPRALGI